MVKKPQPFKVIGTDSRSPTFYYGQKEVLNTVTRFKSESEHK
jgi:hypothetical protein